ncbi:MAG: hypothetical protein R2823_09590 [Acidimicrobiia bacterium]
MYRRFSLRWASGSVAPVGVASSFLARLVGLRSRTLAGIVIDCGTIHTIGMRRPVTVVETSIFGVVTAATVVRPNRIYRRRTGTVLVEIKDGEDAPSVGDRISVLPCPIDARHPHSVRNTDRQPGRHQRTPR